MTTYSRNLATLFRVCCVSLLPLVITVAATDALAIGARLFQDQSNGAVMEISLAAPAPTTVIAEISLPRNIQVAGGEPPPAKIDKKKGIARWLLKDTQPGTYFIRLVTDRPLSLSDCSGKVRFRQPGSGTMVEITAEQ